MRRNEWARGLGSVARPRESGGGRQPLATPVPCLGGVRGSSPQEEGRPAPGRVPKAPQTQPVPRLREAQPFAVPGPGDVFLQEADVEDTEVSWMVSRWPPHKAS